ncbi:PepSY domain-containing protein [Streptomyces luteolus]|uniref:PepSY domain-containing protein n=1 Tax=Streptomyces luteolus TaxID=3043615 RepID=A0ABT6T8A9_9ACTN|nr:PepSY domain-containing protein [Streptomyces sp. B-S-A12]MDI3424064.1 PepSY domain-containing protein [Streptomyces sp. B-S-A12]
MKRNIVIATVAAAALVGGGSAIAFAGSDDGGTGRADARSQNSNSQVTLQDDSDDSDDRDDNNDNDDSAAHEAKDDRRDDARPVGAKLTAAQAVEAALKHQPGTAVSAELDDEDSDDDDSDDGDSGERLAWEVDVLGQGDAWHTVHLDAATGKVIGKKTEDERDDAREARAALKGAETDAAQAARSAAEKGFVTSIDLDDDGRSGHVSEGWEIETAASDGRDGDRDWNVDVRSGKLTVDHDDRHDHDRDDHDDRDDRGDDND